MPKISIAFLRNGRPTTYEHAFDTADEIKGALPIIDSFLEDIGATAGNLVNASSTAPAQATGGASCADCSGEIEGTRGGGGFKAMSPGEVTASRVAKIGDKRNTDTFAQFNRTPRPLCNKCWTPYRKALDIKFGK